MNLFQASLITGILLTLVGGMLTRPKSNFRSAILRFPRSKPLSIWFIGIATTWFLWRHVLFLSEADFGNYKLLIGGVAIGVALLSFVYAADFLAVRGWAMLVLLFSREVLDAAFLQEAQSRLVLVSIVYFFIVVALYFGAWPYRMRDLIEWLNRKPGRMEALGSVILISGLLTSVLSFIY